MTGEIGYQHCLFICWQDCFHLLQKFFGRHYSSAAAAMLGFRIRCHVQFQKYGEKLGRGENVTEWMFRDMVESAGLNTSEDREWIVQAARGAVEPEVEEKLVEEEEEGGGGVESPLILRHPRRQSRGHVTFNQQDDIRPISTLLERSRSAKKEKKEREKEERELSDVTEEVMGEMRERKNSAFSWITNSMRRKKKKPKGSEAEVRNLE